MRLNIELLQEYVKEKGMTQRQFASITGLSQGVVSRLLNEGRGGGMLVTERVLKALPVELWPELLLFSDGESVFRVYEQMKKEAHNSSRPDYSDGDGV